VLNICERPYDPTQPVVCVGKDGKQQIGEVREPLPVRPGSLAKKDNKYKRAGVANLFMAFEPLRGWRHVEVSLRKTRVDFAHFLRRLSDEHYPDVERIVLVSGSLTTHHPAALWQAFAPAEARIKLTNRCPTIEMQQSTSALPRRILG